jgi:hypothetical protein
MSDQSDVTIGQTFQFEVEKESRKKQVTFEYTERSNEQLRVETIEGIPYIVANQAGMLALAKLLITIGAGCHWEGFRLHLRQDFDGTRDEVLRLRLEDSSPDSGQTPEDRRPAAA